ncbi:MAG: hypothetical protein ABIU20_08080 [Blastocatellia bacterium]
MPKLVYFLPCDRVIVSQEQTISLITLIENVILNIPEEKEAELPDDAIVPKEWNAISSYRWEPDDLGKEYEQRVSLTLENDRISTDSIEKIPREDGKFSSRVIIQSQAFPIKPQGEAVLRLAIREVGQENWQVIAEYKIAINRVDKTA